MELFTLLIAIAGIVDVVIGVINLYERKQPPKVKPTETVVLNNHLES